MARGRMTSFVLKQVVGKYMSGLRIKTVNIFKEETQFCIFTFK